MIVSVYGDRNKKKQQQIDETKIDQREGRIGDKVFVSMQWITVTMKMLKTHRLCRNKWIMNTLIYMIFTCFLYEQFLFQPMLQKYEARGLESQFLLTLTIKARFERWLMTTLLLLTKWNQWRWSPFLRGSCSVCLAWSFLCPLRFLIVWQLLPSILGFFFRWVYFQTKPFKALSHCSWKVLQ